MCKVRSCLEEMLKAFEPFEALFEHPSVAEVAAVGMPHENLGETVAVAVVFKHLAFTRLFSDTHSMG